MSTFNQPDCLSKLSIPGSKQVVCKMRGNRYGRKRHAVVAGLGGTPARRRQVWKESRTSRSCPSKHMTRGFDQIDVAAKFDGRPGGNRTPNPRIRNPMLYPLELRAHVGPNNSKRIAYCGPLPPQRTVHSAAFQYSRRSRIRADEKHTWFRSQLEAEILRPCIPASTSW